MAIVQISQITNRKGYNSNLPQLAGAEFGWSTDTRQLYIGNGTIEEGAPAIGNTEILTEFSDLTPVPTTVTLIDNTSVPTTAIRIAAGAVVFSYTIARNGDYRAGIIQIAGSDLEENTPAEYGATGITFSVVYSGGQIELQYVSSSTGFNAQFNYLITVSA
jgi:hypothetical protein